MTKEKIKLSEKDVALLNECGLEKPPISPKVLEKLSMRQLDRLKLMLDRLSSTLGNGVFFQKTIYGIKKNDLEAFSEALESILEHSDS